MATITSRAAVARAIRQPWSIEEIDVDDPKANEVRIKFAAAGMCHSDDHIIQGDAPLRLPMVGGHEGAGVVESVGPDVTRVREGDRVVCSYIPACGACRPCSLGYQNMCVKGLNAGTGMFLDGSYRFHKAGEDLGGFCSLGTFSEYAVVSEYAVIPIEDGVGMDVAALVGCGVPTGWGSAVYAAGVRPGDTVVIFGAGGVGSNAVQGARHAGARHVIVIDPVAFKRDSSVAFGATHTFATAEEAHTFVVAATWGQLADHVIVTASHLTEDIFTAGIAMVGKGGKLTMTSASRLGETPIHVRGGMLTGYQRQVRGALFGDCNPLYDIPRLLRLYQEGQLMLDELISARYTLDQINEAYADLDAGRNLRGVIVFD